MLSAVKHLAADRDRPFAALRVTGRDSSNGQGFVFTKETRKTYRSRSRACLIRYRSRGWAQVWRACCGRRSADRGHYYRPR